MPAPAPDLVPVWVLQEVGRLHLHAVSLERALAEQQAVTAVPADDAPDKENPQ